MTRTHLLKDIDRSAITLTAGIEGELEKNPDYIGDMFFGYAGYAPTDWLELGIAAHTMDYQICPALDARIDVIDLFTDSGVISFLLMGGLGGRLDDLFFAHAGLGLNVRLTRWLQLYLGAGTDSYSETLCLQAGAHLAALKSLGVSANLKLAHGPDGTAFFVSFAPMLTWSARQTGE